MSRFMTRLPDHAQVHSFGGNLRVLAKRNDYLYDVEIELLDDRVTANNWQFANLDQHRPLFAKKPILIAYAQGGRKIGDGHNQRFVRGRDGKERASFTDADSERIIGSLSDDERDIKLENRDGHIWVVGKGTLWAWYAAEAVEKIASQGRMSVSIETLVTKFRMESDVEIEEEYVVLGVTILGDDVTPAVKGAHIRPLSDEVEAEFRELKLRAASYSGSVQTDAGKPAGNTEKGVKPRMNKKVREQMQALFPEHNVLDVSADERAVMLCSHKDGDVSCYMFGENEPGIVLETRFQRANATVNMVTASGYEVTVPLDDVTDTIQRQLSCASDELAKEKKLRADAEKALEDMRKRETKRRCAAVKSAIRAELARLNESLAEADRMDEKVCEDIDKKADEGEYENAADKNGEWCGDQKACAALDALCAPKLAAHLKRLNSKRETINILSDPALDNRRKELVSDTNDLLRAMGVSVNGNR